VKFRAKESLPFAYLLHICMPGLGHVFWHEYLFGVFVYLIMIIASALFFLSFFFPFSGWAKAALFGMPLLFYVFTFFDLTRTHRSGRKNGRGRSYGVAVIFLVVGVLHVAFAPNSPGNFLLRNAPRIHRLDSAGLSPTFARGDLLLINRFAYSAEIFFVDRPVLHSLPDRYSVVSYRTKAGERREGFVLGLPGEQLEISDGVLYVDGIPNDASPGNWTRISGDWPLTSVAGYSILVASLRSGQIDRLTPVVLADVEGKVSKLL
jgi:signal peptidase I